MSLFTLNGLDVKNGFISKLLKENDLWYIQVRVTDKKAVKPHFRRGPTLVCKTTRHAVPLNRPFDMDFDIEHENYERGFGQKEQGDYHVVYRFSVNEIKNAITYGQTGHHEPTGIIRVETEDGVIETDEIPGEIFKLIVQQYYVYQGFSTFMLNLIIINIQPEKT